MSQSTTTKTASFYHFFLMRDGARDASVAIDWAALLQWVEKKELEDRIFDGVIYDCAHEKLPFMLAMHEPLDSAYLSVINRKDGNIRDAMDEAEDSGNEFAHSTAVAFMRNSTNCAAISKGKSESPTHKAIERLLTEALDQGDGTSWHSEPVVEHAEVEALLKANGATRFAGTILTNADLLNQSTSTGIYSHISGMADVAGGDLEVTIGIKLQPGSNNQTSRSKMRNMVESIAERFVPGRRASATIDDADGIRRAISLTTHNVSEQFEIETSARGSILFSELMVELSHVRGMLEDRIKEILEGN